MAQWIRIGYRFINLENVGEILFDEHHRLAVIHFTGGPVLELHDDEAADLRTYLDRMAAGIDETHRTVFVPPGG